MDNPLNNPITQEGPQIVVANMGEGIEAVGRVALQRKMDMSLSLYREAHMRTHAKHGTDDNTPKIPIVTHPFPHTPLPAHTEDWEPQLYLQ